MTRAGMRRGAGLGPGWRTIWVGADPLDAMQHLSSRRIAPRGIYQSEGVRLAHGPARAVGIGAAGCARCSAPWVRRAAE